MLIKNTRKKECTMKRKILIIAFIVTMMISFCACSQPASGSEAAQSASPAKVEESKIAAAPEGEKFETDQFSVIIPKGWEKMEVDGGVQIYKMSGEIVEVHFRGSNQTEESAKQQAQSNADQYKGTAPQEVEKWGKKFWATTFTASGVEQTSFLRIEDGVMIAVKAAGKDHMNNKEITGILDTIAFK
jgi:hypothetical protein